MNYILLSTNIILNDQIKKKIANFGVNCKNFINCCHMGNLNFTIYKKINDII